MWRDGDERCCPPPPWVPDACTDSQDMHKFLVAKRGDCVYIYICGTPFHPNAFSSEPFRPNTFSFDFFHPNLFIMFSELFHPIPFHPNLSSEPFHPIPFHPNLFVRTFSSDTVSSAPFHPTPFHPIPFRPNPFARCRAARPWGGGWGRGGRRGGLGVTPARPPDRAVVGWPNGTASGDDRVQAKRYRMKRFG